MTAKKISMLLSALVMALPSFAQDENSLLYEVSGNDLNAPSYVFGTIHLMCSDEIQMSEVIKEKLATTQQLVLEIDFDEPNVMQEMQQKMMLPDGKTIRDMMSAEDYALVSQFFQDSLMTPITALERFSPVALYGALYTQMLKCQPGSYEMSLMQLTKDEEVIGLETIDEQLAAFNKIPEDEQIEYLTETIKNYDRSLGEFRQLLDAYQAQDVDQLYELSQETMDGIKGMEQHLLIDRNEVWVPKMESLMREQPTFFAVGAGHLGGEHGLIELLEEQGYSVEPMLK